MTGRAVAVRSAAPNDALSIARVHVASWRAAYDGIVPAPILENLSVEHRATYWREATANPGAVGTWVAVVDGDVIGFVSGGPHRDEDLAPRAGEVWSIYVEPRSWRIGIGGALLDHAVADLAKRGFDPLVLWVLTLNESGRGFYERQGWRPDGATRMLDFDGTPIEEMRYRIRAAPGAGVDRTIG